MKKHQKNFSQMLKLVDNCSSIKRINKQINKGEKTTKRKSPHLQGFEFSKGMFLSQSGATTQK